MQTPNRESKNASPLQKLSLNALEYVRDFFWQSYLDESSKMAERPLEGYALTRQQARMSVAYEFFGYAQSLIKTKQQQPKE